MNAGNHFWGFDDPHTKTGQTDDLKIDPVAWHKPTQRQADEGFGEFIQIPPGEHVATITKAWWHTPKNGGQPTLCLRWVLGHGVNKRASLIESHAINGTAKGRQIAISKLREICEACGIDGIPKQITEFEGLTCGIAVGTKPHWADATKTCSFITSHYPA
jgi:hypothetical protein